jgi:hypothetical protein
VINLRNNTMAQFSQVSKGCCDFNQFFITFSGSVFLYHFLRYPFSDVYIQVIHSYCINKRFPK